MLGVAVAWMVFSVSKAAGTTGALNKTVMCLGVFVRTVVVGRPWIQCQGGRILEEMEFGERFRACLAPIQACSIKNERGSAGFKLRGFVKSVVGCGLM